MAEIVRIGVCSPRVSVADPDANAREIIRLTEEAERQEADLLVFPELCLTGATCGDLFKSAVLLKGAEDALEAVKKATRGKKTTVVVGLPRQYKGKILNVTVVLRDGAELCAVPKNTLTIEEKRYFQVGKFQGEMPDICSLSLRVDWKARGAKNAAITVIPSATAYTVGEAKRKRALTLGCSKGGAAVYACAGFGESTTDDVFSGYAAVCANGNVLYENPPFAYNEIGICAFSLEEIKRAKVTAQKIKIDETPITPNLPFLCEKAEYETIMRAVATGLASRMRAVKNEKLVLGVSGGLDSTLALLTSLRALDMLHLPHERLVAISMPCFGTSDKTKNSAAKLCELSGATAREICIKESVTLHLKEIGHNGAHDSAYENAQARMRTMVLMDTANHEGGLVVGTGDLSEEALGWCTFGGDHFSNYNVNASIPKTLVKALVAYEAERLGGAWAEILHTVLGTEISPELLPPENGKIAQKTEEIIGSYEMNDFFLYHAIFGGKPPEEVLRLAAEVFGGEADEYSQPLARFYKRFFGAQFKRSCAPDGVSIGHSLSPRGSWRMPSDASVALWLKQTEAVKE
ncbi:MAG: NAD(+) synthase [Clostridiales bacterium]|nr:NAD(+) synthase [Clostridiales bacterium]